MMDDGLQAIARIAPVDTQRILVPIVPAVEGGFPSLSNQEVSP